MADQAGVQPRRRTAEGARVPDGDAARPSAADLARVFPRTAAFSAGRLTAVGGVEVTRLAREHGTPLYVLDRAELLGRMRAYRAAFGEVTVAYAAKALCVVGVLQLAAREGLHLDVASGGELHTALRAGFPMARVIFHGNNKSVAELERAVGLGVGRIVVDSFSELRRLAAVTARLGRRADVVLRVTPGVEAHTHAFIRTGHDDSKFGFTLSSGLAHEAVEQALATPGVALRGLHCHVGSQILAAEAFAAAAEVMVGLLADVHRRHDVVLEELNLGGGLGIAYTSDDETLAVEVYAQRLQGAVRAAARAHRQPPPRLAVEPGRSIAGPAGITLYTVGTVKELPGLRTYVSVDGGMSDNPRPALYGADYAFAAAGPARVAGPGSPSTPTLRAFAVAGKHCESGDVLAREAHLPGDLAEGDLLAVAVTGAYAYSMASNYNRLPRPAMVLVGDGRSDLLVRRETVEDVVALDLPLPGWAGA